MLQAVMFYVFAVLTIISGITVVTRRNPISAAVALVVSFFFLAAMYVMLGAHFVAITQVLVYAGAIMVLFIFVIMLLNLREEGPSPLEEFGVRAVGGLSVAGLVGTGIVVAIESVAYEPMGPIDANFGTIEAVGEAMFGGPYLLPFEIASALLTVAMVGAVVLAKREI